MYEKSLAAVFVLYVQFSNFLLTIYSHRVYEWTSVVSPVSAVG